MMSAPRTASSADCRRAKLRRRVPGHLRHEALAAGLPRRPDADLAERAHFGQRLEMAARLHARAEDRQRRRLGSREVPRRHRRNGRGSRLGDVTAVEDGLERAGVRIQQDDGGQVRRKAARLVAVEHGDELRAEPRRLRDVGRHDAEVRLAWARP